MPGFAIRDTVGVQPLTAAWALDTNLSGMQGNNLFSQGQIVAADDLWWGGVEAMFVKFNGTVRQFGLCVVTPTFNSTTNQWEYLATEVPNTANLGRSLGVALRAATTGQFGWLIISGVVPVNCNAAVAADTTFGIAAAGQGGANGAGKQVLNARVVGASTTTVAKAGVAISGSNQLTVNNSDGWFPGLYLSGTGIAGGTTISGISADGRTVTLSANTTAAVNGTVTGTYNNATVYYNIAHLNRPFAQGAIT